jgi:hypothetical protein
MWKVGFQGQYTITKGSQAALDGWSVAFRLPPGETIVRVRDGVLSRNGNVHAVTGAGWNADAGAGAALSFGFTGSHASGYQDPFGCPLDGAACTARCRPRPPQ